MANEYNALYDAFVAAFPAQEIINAVESIKCSAMAAVMAPSVLYRPTLSKDGNQWCALLGEDLQVGLAGFGDTPAKAMQDFDNRFYQA